MCDVEKYIDNYSEKGDMVKNEMQSGVGLQDFQIEIKGKFGANLDEIHSEFLDKYFMEYDDTKDREICLIRDVFEFIKSII